jgi:hypothetical protein
VFDGCGVDGLDIKFRRTMQQIDVGLKMSAKASRSQGILAWGRGNRKCNTKSRLLERSSPTRNAIHLHTKGHPFLRVIFGRNAAAIIDFDCSEN